jgi:hypothetical protein
VLAIRIDFFAEMLPLARSKEGESGNGNRWRHDAKATTDNYRILDARRMAREGVPRPGYWGSWQWTRDGETVATIPMRAE